MIRIDEPALPIRPLAELRAAADRHTDRLRRRLRRRTIGLGGTALVVVLALAASATSRPVDNVRTIRPADRGEIVDDAPEVDIEAEAPVGVGQWTDRRSSEPASQGESNRATASEAPSDSPSGPMLVQSQTKLLFVRQSGGLWELSLDDGRMRKLQDANFAGRWSPDGRRIVLETGSGLALLDVASGEKTVLFERDHLEQDSVRRPSWLPEGSAVVFERNRQTGTTTWETALWTVDVRTRELRRLLVGSEPSVGRDGRILYRCDTGYCLTDATGADLGPVSNTNNLSDAVLSPNGQWIAALHTTNSSGPGLVVQRIDGLKRRTLVAGGTFGRPAWFPDGSRVAFTPMPTHSLEPEGEHGIRSVRVDGTDVRQHTDGGGGDDLNPDLAFAP